MDKKNFEFSGNQNEGASVEPMVRELSDLHLALIAGGIGDTIL